VNDEVRTRCCTALAALDQALQESSNEVQESLEQALCCLVQMRDALIGQARTTPSHIDPSLKHINAVLSMVVGTEYPVSGIRRDNIRQARTALTRLLAQ
jgi:hypothetical protein